MVRPTTMAASVALVVAIALAEGFSFEMEITQGPGGPHINMMQDGHEAGPDEYSFLSKMRQHMQRIAQASQHVFHRSPLEGLFEDIDHIFDDREEQSPLARLHELAHRTKSDHELRHHDFQSAREGHEPMLAIMDMMRQMTRPLIAREVVPLHRGPPRGLVALACHRDAVTYCREFCSCWEGMTKCLAEHAHQIQPRCHHLLAASGILEPEVEEEPRKPLLDLGDDDEAPQPPEEEEERAEAKEEEAEEQEEAKKQEEANEKEEAKKEQEEAKEEHPLLGGAMPPLSMQNALQRMHDSLKHDIAATRDAAHRDAQEPPVESSPVEKSAQSPPQEASSNMAESTPAWLTGDVEAPAGEKDMGGWTMRAYTPEQQARLHVDEEGRPTKGAKAAPEDTAQASPLADEPELLEETSTWQQKLKAAIQAYPKCHMVMGALALMLFLFAISYMCGRLHRRSQAAALSTRYARITLNPHVASPKSEAMTVIGSEDQI